MDFNLAEFLYEEHSLGVFLLVTVAMGGGAAWLSGRAIAATWRPWWQVACYMLILGFAVRFFHYALFGGTLLSPHYYLVDTAFCLLFGFLGFRATRARQMATQYRWIYGSRGLLGWRRQRAAEASESG
jgi:hypothetical protein